MSGSGEEEIDVSGVEWARTCGRWGSAAGPVRPGPQGQEDET